MKAWKGTAMSGSADATWNVAGDGDEEEENADADDITVTRFINSEGLDGKYDVYLEVYDKIYNLHQQVSF